MVRLDRIVASVALLCVGLPVLGVAAERTNSVEVAAANVERLNFRAMTAYNVDPGVVMSGAYSVTEMLTAFDVDPSIVVSPSMTGNDRQFGIFPTLGALSPTMGSNFAWLSSGVAGAGTPQSVDPTATNTESGTNVGSSCPSGTGYDCAFLKFSFQVPAGMNSINFNFNFMSVEYPEFVNLGFNDEFTVKLSSPTYNYANIVFDMNGQPVNIDSAFFNQPCSGLAGTGFEIYSGGSCDAGATGLLTTEAPIMPGETVTLEFSIRDRGDGIYDSAVMLDNFTISPETVDGPSTGGEVQIDWLSPKSGIVAGGTQVQIHGQGFINVQSVAFGGTPALYQALDEFTIVAVTPPHSVGPVDVSVTASPNNNASTGVKANGFMYFVHPEGAPLAVLSVDPPEGPADGNQMVTVRGSGFGLDSVVTFDGVPVASSQFMNGDEIVVTTPEGRGGVEVRVTNVDGATAALEEGYLYLGAGSGNGASSAGGCGCSIEPRGANGATPIVVTLVGLILAAWTVRRRRFNVGLAATMLVVPVAMLSAGCNDQTLAPVNAGPVADAGPSGEAFTGEPIVLDGSESNDFEDGGNLTFAWSFMTKPEGSTAELDDVTAKQPTFTPDVPGLYRIGLVVTDSDDISSPEIGYGGTDDDNLVDYVALPYRDMRVTLTWDTDASDLDLHLIRGPAFGTVLNGYYWNAAADCFYGVPDQDWGTVGIMADNPVLEADVDTGFGPEIIALPSPQDVGNYFVVAHVFNAHGAGATSGVAKIELNGELVAEVYTAAPLPGTDAVWVVGKIVWPEGTFEEINMQSTHSTLGGGPH